VTAGVGGRAPALAPFRVRSFRFQWPADLATSWAFEMEALILGWYVLVATGSVQQLVIFGALAWVGSLFSPLFGLASDRIGARALLCATRGIYALQSALLMALALGDALEPWHVFAISAVAGLLRPSDMGMRSMLVGQTMRPELLMGALGISRTTTDTAKIAGALAGTGGVALLGMGPAYVAVTALYVVAFLCTLGVAGAPRRAAQPQLQPRAAEVRAHPLAGLHQGMRYVWESPALLAAFTLAFLANLLAFPFFMGLLPYAAKDVYGIGQAGLGYLAAAFSAGALAGSLLLGSGRLRLRAGRTVLWSVAAWFVALLLFGQTRSTAPGLALLFAAGFVQSLCMTPLAAVMLRTSSEEMRGRVMGFRMLAIWGLPLGLLAAGPVIDRFGYAASTLAYAVLGLAATLAIGWRWRDTLWQRTAASNALPGRL
jgi:predicted MFS family arabinose efflux permease